MKSDAVIDAMKPLLETYQKIKQLLEIGEFDIISSDELENKLSMKKKEILAKHKENYSIWHSSDGRWRTKVPDKTKPKGVKQIAKTSEDALNDAIVDWYTKDKTPDTLEALFPEWIDFKAKDTTPANAHKLSWAWDTYYRGEAITKRPISTLDVIEVKSWLLDTIQKQGLTRKQYKGMKTVINQLFDYAIEKRQATVNIARNVSRISGKHFAVEEKKQASKQVYMIDEISEIIGICEEMFEKTDNTAYLGIRLNFYLGLRVGELVALKVSDFSDLYVHIEREEIKRYTNRNGKITRNGYTVADYTKTPDSVRDIPLISEARRYVKMIIEQNRKNGFCSDYLLLDKKSGERIHNDGINNTLRRANKNLATPQKGNHSIRKTYISSLDAFSELTDEEIRTVAGHKYISTTQNSYLYSVQKPENRVVEFEKALMRKSVTHAQDGALRAGGTRLAPTEPKARP